MNQNSRRKVRWLNDVGEGVVLEIRANEARILRDDGFDEWYPLSELVFLDDEDILEYYVTTHDIRPKDQPVIQVNSNTKIEPVDRCMEVDLHIHQLVNDERQVSKDKILDIQMFHARKALDEARKKRMRKLVLIHGIGQGVLRKALHQWLDGLDKLQYYDASFQKYGQGATEIELW